MVMSLLSGAETGQRGAWKKDIRGKIIVLN